MRAFVLALQIVLCASLSQPQSSLDTLGSQSTKNLDVGQHAAYSETNESVQITAAGQPVLDGRKSGSTLSRLSFDVMYWTRYWFMCPVALCVSICANLVGIGGAAFFAPFFIVCLPLLGPSYQLQSPLAAVAISLCVELCGFSSGIAGYMRRGLIDFSLAGKFAIATVPASIAAISLFSYVPVLLLKGLYVTLMLCLCMYLLLFKAPLLGDKAEGKEERSLLAPVSAPGSCNQGSEGTNVEGDTPGQSSAGADVWSSIIDADGITHRYPIVKVAAPGYILTVMGGLLMGFLGVGAGEVVLPQLLHSCVPVTVAAPTSMAVVVITVAATVWAQIAVLMGHGGADAIPWNVLCWMAPTVICGAQIGVYLQGKIAQVAVERAIGVVFGVVGLLFSIAIVYESKWLSS